MGRQFGQRGYSRLVQPTEEPALANISWVLYSSSMVIGGQENVSSVTEDGAGLHTVTWTRPFLSASSYAATVCSSTANPFAALSGHFDSLHTITASSISTRFNDYNTQSATNPTVVYLMAIGEF